MATALEKKATKALDDLEAWLDEQVELGLWSSVPSRKKQVSGLVRRLAGAGMPGLADQLRRAAAALDAGPTPEAVAEFGRTSLMLRRWRGREALDQAWREALTPRVSEPGEDSSAVSDAPRELLGQPCEIVAEQAVGLAVAAEQWQQLLDVDPWLERATMVLRADLGHGDDRYRLTDDDHSIPLLNPVADLHSLAVATAGHRRPAVICDLSVEGALVRGVQHRGRWVRPRPAPGAPKDGKAVPARSWDGAFAETGRPGAAAGTPARAGRLAVEEWALRAARLPVEEPCEPLALEPAPGPWVSDATAEEIRKLLGPTHTRVTGWRLVKVLRERGLMMPDELQLALWLCSGGWSDEVVQFVQPGAALRRLAVIDATLPGARRLTGEERDMEVHPIVDARKDWSGVGLSGWDELSTEDRCDQVRWLKRHDPATALRLVEQELTERGRSRRRVSLLQALVIPRQDAHIPLLKRVAEQDDDPVAQEARRRLRTPHIAESVEICEEILRRTVAVRSSGEGDGPVVEFSPLPAEPSVPVYMWLNGQRPSRAELLSVVPPARWPELVGIEVYDLADAEVRGLAPGELGEMLARAASLSQDSRLATRAVHCVPTQWMHWCHDLMELPDVQADLEARLRREPLGSVPVRWPWSPGMVDAHLLALDREAPCSQALKAMQECARQVPLDRAEGMADSFDELADRMYYAFAWDDGPEPDMILVSDLHDRALQLRTMVRLAAAMDDQARAAGVLPGE